MRSIKSSLYLVLITFFSFTISGCFLRFYKVESPQQENFTSTLEQTATSYRYFILHEGNAVFGISEIKVDKVKQAIRLAVTKVDSSHTAYLQNPGKKTYKQKDANILTEIHLYSNDSITHAFGDTFTLPIAMLSKIEILEKNRGATTANHILSVLGVTIGILGFVAVIVALTKSSCPFVSGYDGKEFSLQGEIYGGAIYRSLQRDDYLPLQLQPVNGLLQVKISNELQEKQHTDIAELWAILHDPAIKVLPDEYGNVYSISEEAAPISAMVNDKDVSEQLITGDDKFYNFNSEQQNGITQLQLSFNKPVDANKAKLVLHLKNSYWLDHVYGELIKRLGSYFTTWSRQQQNRSADELNKWKREQAIPLTIEIKTTEGWREIQSLTTIGPVAYRAVVVPVDLKDVDSKNLEFRLSTGFMFWEIDKVAIDYSSSRNYKLIKLQPASATDELNNDVRQSLMKVDQSFLEQPIPGNVATINYIAPAVKDGMKLTYILHANGYYEHVRDFSGIPDKKFLQQFRQPQALSKFSMNKFQELSLAKAN